jgi:6-phosphogluconolactonase
MPVDELSRRTFLTGTAAAMPLLAQSATPKKILAYVGTYSSPQGPEGSKGRGQGIYLFEFDRASGILSQRDVFADASNPSWLAFSPSRTHLYAANETATYQGTSSGSVSAFAIDRSSGRLTPLNTVSSEGAGPAHLSVHPSGRYVLVANYAGGTVAVLPINSNGELGRATDIKKDQGAPGAANASSAPRGSFAISGHDRPHAHMIQSDPSGRFVLSSDLALDQIFVWRFDAEKGTLSPNDPHAIRFPSGDGPRHFAFHPNGRWLYSLQEEASTIVTFDWDAKHGGATARQTISTLPEGFAGTNFTSEIMISVDGKFVYAANRLHDTVAWFSIEAGGKLSYVGEEWTRGDYPRSFNTDPSGEFLFTCNQRSDAIATFRVDRNSGALAFTGRYTPVGTPAIIVFLT